MDAFLILTRVRERIAADFEAAALKGATRRAPDVRALDALTEIMGNRKVLALVTEEIEKEMPHVD